MKPSFFHNGGHLVALVLLATLLPGVRPAVAHPHVWIDARATFQLDAERRVEAIDIEWRFDEFFSAYALEELQVESGDAVSDEQRAMLAEQYLSNLVEWHYMTELAVDEDYAEFGAATDYRVEIEADIVTLFFTLPLTEPIDPGAHEVGLRMYDPTYYISIEYAGDDPIAIDGADTASCTARVDDSAPDMETVPLGESGFMASERATDIGFFYAQTGRLHCE